MTLSRETGGATGIHISLCGDNKSLIKIKKNVWTESWNLASDIY